MVMRERATQIGAAIQVRFAGLVNAAAAQAARTACNYVLSNLLQNLRESVIDGTPRGYEAEASMGEVIVGPWRQREGPDLMRALGDEIVRMTAALERLRELHKRGEALDLRGDVDAGRK
jgi:hypothetical protein